MVARRARPRGLRGWAGLLRRRLGARVRGRQDVDTLIAEGMTVGREVFVADDVYIDPGFAWLISIGDQTTVGPGVTILAHDATPKLRTGYSAVARVALGARVFIGANAVILPGVEIGDDAIVGAGASSAATSRPTWSSPAIRPSRSGRPTSTRRATWPSSPNARAIELGRPPDADGARADPAAGASHGYVD